MKIQTQTAILFTTITAIVILLLSFFVYYFTSKFAATDFYKRLEIRAYIAARVALEKDETSINSYSEIRREHLEVLPGEREFIINKDTLAKQGWAMADLSLPRSFFENIVVNKKDYYLQGNFYYTGILYNDNEGDFIVLITAGNEYLSNTMYNLRTLLLLGFLAGIIVAYSTAIFFSRYTFKPVRTIIKKVNNINAENLSMRLPERKGKDEIGELSYTFNEMLTRLQTSFETQNNFISNASHEFRTPITTILGEVELSLLPSRSKVELQQTMQRILIEVEKLQHISDSLLSLAQTGFDGKRQIWKQIRIDELVCEVKHSVQEIANTNTIELQFNNLPETADDLIVLGNEQLLKLALSNIVLNGCKYSNNKAVQLSIQVFEDYIHIVVQDEGIGIPADELEHIFEPFFRASNSLKFQGYGIGLPLSLNIIRLHHGMIKVASAQNQGTKVLVILPLHR